MKSVTPSFWRYALSQWDLRDFYYLIEGPHFGRSRIMSFICLVLELFLSVTSFLLGKRIADVVLDLDFTWIRETIVSIFLSVVIKYALNHLTVSLFRCSRKRSTLTQQKRKHLRCRRFLALLILINYLPGVIATTVTLYRMSEYPQNRMGVAEMMLDWAKFFALDIPVSLMVTAARYYSCANRCNSKKDTTNITQYKEIVKKNRAIQLRLESAGQYQPQMIQVLT